MKNDLLDIYTDYLISSFGATTATGLSALLEDEISHDKITRMLSEPAETPKELWLRVKANRTGNCTESFPLTLAKQVFKNEDNSTGTLYLVSNDTELFYDRISTIYKKRWNVECYHKSLKQNASLAKSPTKTRTTQTNHFFASLYAYIKFEQLKISTKLNHFALKQKLYINAVQSAFAQLHKFQNSISCVT